MRKYGKDWDSVFKHLKDDRTLDQVKSKGLRVLKDIKKNNSSPYRFLLTWLVFYLLILRSYNNFNDGRMNWT